VPKSGATCSASNPSDGGGPLFRLLAHHPQPREETCESEHEYYPRNVVAGKRQSMEKHGAKADAPPLRSGPWDISPNMQQEGNHRHKDNGTPKESSSRGAIDRSAPPVRQSYAAHATGDVLTALSRAASCRSRALRPGAHARAPGRAPHLFGCRAAQRPRPHTAQRLPGGCTSRSS
jgi:hypothetical protein